MRRLDFTVGVIAAMKMEAEDIISAMTDITEREISGIRFCTGKLYGINCVTAVCGIGKVFAAVCAQTMILEYAPDLIINTGVAGTLTEKLSIGDIIIADKLVQHDMDTSALGDPVGMISGINLVYLPCSGEYSELLMTAAEDLDRVKRLRGTIASGDRFMCDSTEKKRVSSLFGAAACEMEGASIAQVCYINNLPCCVMRAISDGGDESASVDYPAFAKAAAEKSASVIKRFFLLL